MSVKIGWVNLGLNYTHIHKMYIFYVLRINRDEKETLKKYREERMVEKYDDFILWDLIDGSWIDYFVKLVQEHVPINIYFLLCVSFRLSQQILILFSSTIELNKDPKSDYKNSHALHWYAMASFIYALSCR